MLFPLIECIVFDFVLFLVRSDSEFFISENSVLAVVIDEEFVKMEHKNVKATIDDFVRITRDLQAKGLNLKIQYHTSLGVNFKRDVLLINMSYCPSSDISGVLTVASCYNTWNLFERADRDFVPFIAISETDCPRLPMGKAISIPLTKVGEELPQLLLDLRTSSIFKWRSVVLIHDDSLNRDMVARVTSSLTEDLPVPAQSTALSLIKFEKLESEDKGQSLIDRLASISSRKSDSNFLVVSYRKVVETVMEAVDLMNLVNTETQWCYAISDTNRGSRKNLRKLKKSLKNGSNVAVMYNNTVTDAECFRGLLCHFETLVAAFATAFYETEKNEFDIADQVSGEEWEAIKPSKSERRTYLLEKVLMYLRKNGKCDNCTSWLLRSADTWGSEFKNDGNETSIQLNRVGSWTAVLGAEMSDELFLHVAHGFRRKTLRLVTVHNPPWQIISTDTSKGLTKYTGLTFDIINELSRKLNFTYTLQVLPVEEKRKQTSLNFQQVYNFSGSPGDRVEDLANLVTNWIPPNMIDMIANGTVALGAYGSTVTEKYLNKIDFTIPISTQPYTFLVARPKELSRALLFMAPFSGDTWLCLMVAILSVGPILYFIHKVSPMPDQRERAGGLFSIQNCIWYMYGALLQQGGMHLPQADSARILVGAWWLVVLVIATTYCGNLVAFLTFPEMEKPLTTFDDLLAQKDRIFWSMIEGSYIEDELQNFGDSKYKLLYNMRVKNQTREKILIEVAAGKQVFIDWKLHLQYLMRREYIKSNKCEYALATEEVFNERIGLILSKKNPYLYRINKGIKELHQVGLIHKWLTGYLPKKEKCWRIGQVLQANNHIVNMDDMQGSFFVLFLGFLFALIFIIGERIWFYHKTKKKKKSIEPYTM
ncbi:ionotropic receptor 93a [Coccinella septempunctata]|uniref:ionotropic receptor 93a n=1 Tax=Coccinella septempunctata TaxID=41139 RepID=UPI001D08C3F4|nr:ionotropic receptor 93a [Coccinella septempunctata]